MIEIRKGGDRGHARHGWLDSRHSFSFADYHDPAHMGFGPLRVINEDRVAPGKGFGTHGHRDMEILSYVLDGQLEHRDSLGNGSVIVPGDVQRMSAGTGVQHSEYNPSRVEPVHFLQIWIEPAIRGAQPGYEQQHATEEARRNTLRVIACPEGGDGAVQLNQDARVHAALLDGDDAVEYILPPGRRAYVHVARGALHVNDLPLAAGDAVKIAGQSAIRIDRAAGAEVLLFDLP
ncbi:MAG: pirin family protein [Casimicrobiaceae bacterium]